MARMHETRETPGPRRSPRAQAAKARPAAPDGQQQHLQDYRNALQFMQENKFEKAKAIFEKLVLEASPELVERIRVYQTVCEKRSGTASLKFGTPEEQYDYAVSLLNTGNFEDARDQFESILASHPNADFACYGMALLNSMTGQNEEALEHLARAIQLNPAHRIQARNDPDFLDMVDDPRFTELLYPEAG